MTTSLKSNYQNDSKKDVIVFIVFIGFIVFAIYIFNHYNGAKYIQDTWNSWFAMRNKTIVSENKLPAEKKTCSRAYSFSSKMFISTPCEMTRSEALKYCSKKFQNELAENPNIFKLVKNISNLGELRDYLIKTCMQENGLDY